MALQLDYNYNGITIPNAYYKMTQMLVAKYFITIHVEIFATAGDVNKGNMIDSTSYRMDYNPAGGEPLTQAYNYLKTLPEFAGATDV